MMGLIPNIVSMEPILRETITFGVIRRVGTIIR